ncbi:MAG: arylsulfatase [Betaproteobacteria bacterium]|nr:arylsulfatase [Betaproteobacteria bacterium]
MPKIYLVHAVAISMAPVEASFRKIWPGARLAHLLDDSLYSDFNLDGRLTEAMIERFRELGRYCARAHADALLFTCSAFGPAIDAVKSDQKIPVLKPNEALYDELVAKGGRAALLATYPPSLPSMRAEIETHASKKGARLEIHTRLVEGALDALMSGRAEQHHQLIAEAAPAFADYDSIAFAQFSMAPAVDLAEARVGRSVLTTPDSAVRKLKALML